MLTIISRNAITTTRSYALASLCRSMATRAQPPWPQPPVTAPDLSPLTIWNSLTRSKTPFQPMNGRDVHIYYCGPTVYDDAHLGHARNYVSSDIIFRILRDYFKLNLKTVSNITDVEDKIIIRARQQHLLEEFISRSSEREVVLETSQAALKAYLLKNLGLVPRETKIAQLEATVKQYYGSVLQATSLDGGKPVGDNEAKTKMHIKTVLSAAEAMQRSGMAIEEFYTKTQDILLPYLDSLHALFINADDHTIFTKLTTKYENRFMEDVRALNCLDPDIVTRVTEYIPHIINFVEKIMRNGFAYKTSDNSVYFDIGAFEAAGNHYARLEPWNRNNQDLQADGEGALAKRTTEKKSDADFVLWKSSKPGEPSWQSPWGKGRPGWHIECSAMASEILGSRFDIHAGGIDLAFPHHDNELAQSEAYWFNKSHPQQQPWVNYFIHIGHLSIQGSKMSKSLKNFTTIREALDRGDWTPRSLRIVFLFGSWRDGIEITDSVVREGTAWEEKLNNFFIKCNDMLSNESSTRESGTQGAIDLMPASVKAKEESHQALCDSFNTRQVLMSISELVTAFNSTEKHQLRLDDVREVAKWITYMVNMFGLNGMASPTSDVIGWSGVSIPDAAKPYVYPLSHVRDEVRQKARSETGIRSEDLRIVSVLRASGPEGALPEDNPYAKVARDFANDLEALKGSQNLGKEVLKLCDRLRDVDLWNQGIYLEDSNANEPALVRPVSKELLAARQEKEGRDRQKQQAKEEREKEAAAKAEKGRLSHLEMYRTSEYSAWDAEGLPTEDAKGDEVNKSQGKKLRKNWEKQKKLHEAWLKTQ